MASEADHHPPASEEEGAGYASPAVDMFAALALIALAIWYTVTALGFRTPGGWQTGPGLVPAAAGISLAAMAIGLGISAWRRRGQSAPLSEASDDQDIDFRRTGIIIAIALIYALALETISMPVSTTIAGMYLEAGIFEVATILCLAVLMQLFWGGRFWIIATLSVVWTMVLSLIFRNVFFIFLPA